MEDKAKLALFDDLAEIIEDLRDENAQLKLELEMNSRRFSTLAWTLECALKVALNLPSGPDEELKTTRQRKKGK